MHNDIKQVINSINAGEILKHTSTPKPPCDIVTFPSPPADKPFNLDVPSSTAHLRDVAHCEKLSLEGLDRPCTPDWEGSTAEQDECAELTAGNGSSETMFTSGMCNS